MKKTRLIALLLATVMILSACGKTPTTPDVPTDKPSDKPTDAYTGPKDLMDWTTSMTTFNPQMYTSSKFFMNLGSFVASVATKDHTNKIEFIPHHASALPKSTDGGTTWEIKIRDDIKWADGTPLNAKTYEYTMKMLIDPKLTNKNAKYLFDTCIVKNAQNYFSGKAAWEDVGVKLIDDTTLQIVLEYPATELDFYTSISSLIWPVQEEMYEKCMNADRTSTTYGTTLETTPSCGSFTLTEWITDGNDKHVINADDPLVKLGYFNVDSIDRRYISQNTTRAEMFFSGKLDQHSLSGDDYITYKNDPRAMTTLSPNVWGFFMNGKSKNTIMQDADFRQALYFGAPRDEAARDVFKLYPAAPYLIATGIYVGDPIKGGDYYRETPAAKKLMETYKSDDDKAKQLFEKAYATNGGTPVSVEYIYFEGQEDQKRQAEILQETYEGMFGKDRFTMTLRAMPPAAAYDVYRAGDYDLGLGVRLANIFNPWATMNVWASDYADKYITGFENKEFDDLQSRSVYGDLVQKPEERTAALARMEELLLEYGCFVPMFQNDNVVMYSDRVALATDEYLPFIGYNLKQCDLTAAAASN